MVSGAVERVAWLRGEIDNGGGGMGPAVGGGGGGGGLGSVPL